MTLLDWLVVFVGFGIAWKLPKPFSVPYVAMLSPVVVVYLLALQVLLSIGVVVTLVVFSRQILYRRSMRAAEWLVVAAVALTLSDVAPDLDTTLDGACRAITGHGHLDWTLWRWAAAAISLDVALVLVLACVYWRHVIPPWLSTIGLTVAVAILAWGPFDAWAREHPFPDAAVATWRSPFFSELYFAGRAACAALPIYLLLGVPAVASVKSLVRLERRWVWTEWVAFGVSCVLVASYLVFVAYAWSANKTIPEQVASALPLVLLLAIVVSFSLIVLRCARWVESRQ